MNEKWKKEGRSCSTNYKQWQVVQGITTLNRHETRVKNISGRQKSVST